MTGLLLGDETNLCAQDQERVRGRERVPGNSTLLCSPRVFSRLAAAQTLLLFPQIISGHEPNGWSHKRVPQMFQRREGKRGALPRVTGAAGGEAKCWRRVGREKLCFDAENVA